MNDSCVLFCFVSVPVFFCESPFGPALPPLLFAPSLLLSPPQLRVSARFLSPRDLPSLVLAITSRLTKLSTRYHYCLLCQRGVTPACFSFSSTTFRLDLLQSYLKWHRSTTLVAECLLITTRKPILLLFLPFISTSFICGLSFAWLLLFFFHVHNQAFLSEGVDTHGNGQ